MTSVVWAQPPLLADIILKDAGFNPVDGADLVDFLHKRAQPGDVSTFAKFTKQLRDPKAEERNAAIRELIKHGASAVPALRAAANDLDDLPAAALARICLKSIDGKSGATLVGIVVRQVAALRPPGAVAALIEYLPYSDDDAVATEVSRAIVSMTGREGKPDPALVRALEDGSVARRAAAADALCPLNDEALRPALRRLLKDPKPMVRLRAAIGLCEANDEQAVPVLIDLVGELPSGRWQEVNAQLLRLAGEWAINVPPGDDDVSRRLRRQAWLSWWQSVEGDKLVESLRKVTPGEGSANPAPVPSAIFRLLLVRKPDGAVAALLGYLPFADNEKARLAIEADLRALAMRDGKLDPALVTALDDRLSVRRLAAAEVLLEAGGLSELPRARKLLKDDDPLVRVRVGFALIAVRDREAIPTLIDMMADLPPEHGALVEQLLVRLAGDKAIKVPLQGDDVARRKCREAWAKWWQDDGAKIDLAKIENPRGLLGQTTIVEGGRVLAMDNRGKVCWQIDGLRDAKDAQPLPNGRVLILEATGTRLTERDITGKIHWQKDLENPCVSFERLANGNTFVAWQYQIVEYDKDGKEVFTHKRPGNDVFIARKLPDGQVAFITTDETYVRIDADQKEQKRFAVPIRIFKNVEIWRFSNAEILPGDRVLVTQQAPNPAQNRVFEFDGTASVWEYKVNLPSQATRLPNGNTLIASTNTSRVVEVDRTGATVWECKEGIQPLRARRR
jgi:HEAT repeat protein